MTDAKVVAAICLAPVVLARAGVLVGRRATVAGTFAAELEQCAATYTGPGVTVDGALLDQPDQDGRMPAPDRISGLST